MYLGSNFNPSGRYTGALAIEHGFKFSSSVMFPSPAASARCDSHRSTCATAQVPGTSGRSIAARGGLSWGPAGNRLDVRRAACLRARGRRATSTGMVTTRGKAGHSCALRREPRVVALAGGRRRRACASGLERTTAPTAVQAAALLATAAIQNGDFAGLILVSDRIEFELEPAGGVRHPRRSCVLWWRPRRARPRRS